MLRSFTIALGYSAPTQRHPKALASYGYLRVTARSEEEARNIVEEHLVLCHS